MVRDRPLVSGLFWGLSHSALMALAFPRVGLWPAVLVAVTPLAAAGLRASRPLWAGLGVAVGTLPFWALTHWWVWEISDAGLPVLLLYLSIYPGLFVWLIARLRLRGAGVGVLLPVAPVLWVGLEVLRGEFVFDGYPWYLVGQPLIDAPIGFIGTTLGMYGASALAACVGCAASAAFLERAQRRAWRRPAWMGAGVLVLAGLLSLVGARGGAAGQTLRVAVVQSNIPQSNKDSPDFDTRLANFSTMLRLTSEAAHLDPAPDLIVWPETMFPGTSLSPEAVEVERRSNLGYRGVNFPLTGWHDQLVKLQGDLGIPMIVGATAVEGLKFVTDAPPDDPASGGGGLRMEHGRVFNSAFVIEGGKVSAERYDKVHLTPFGEVMPYISKWKWLERRLLALGAAGMEFDLSEGERASAVAVPVARLGEEGAKGAGVVGVATPICFEGSMPSVVRSLCRAAAAKPAVRVIINLTNDGWFGGSVAGRLNHVLCARWRCLELGLPMIRAANTGVSCLIDGRGRLVQIGPNDAEADASKHGANTQGVMSVELPLPVSGAGTLYSRMGDIVGRACLVLTLVVAVLVLMVRPRASTGLAGAGR